VSLYRDILDGIRTAIEQNGRIVALGAAVEKLADKVDGMDRRLVRLETIVELARSPSAGVLRLAPPDEPAER
jgi:hypothetical protein